MNEVQEQEVPSQKETGKTGIGFLDCLVILTKRKKLIAGVPLLAAIITAGVSLAIPNVYSASTKLMPPQQSQASPAALLSQLGGVAGAVAGSAGLKNPNDLYVAMLKSQTVADKLITKFNLKVTYETDSQEDARKILAKRTVISSGKDGLISITVEDKNKKVVADMANAYVSELFALTKVLALTEAAKRRVFYERQFEQAKNNLADAEIALKSGLNSNGVVSVDAESRVIVETVGRLRAQVSAKEIQLNSMSAFVTTNNPEYRKVQEELSSLKNELSKLENGRAKETLADQKAGNSPGGLENIKLLRDVKYHQMLYELLAKQYEIARIDEARDPAIVQVLDPAAEPERKIKPQRTILVLLSFAISLVFTIAWSLSKEGFFASWMNQSDIEKWAKIKRNLGGN